MTSVNQKTGFAFERSDFALEGASAESFVAAAIAGDLYFNAHSTAFPAGEVRGQLEAIEDTRDGDGFGTLVLGAVLGGDQEVPPADTDARGVGRVEIVVSEAGVTVHAAVKVAGLDLSDLTLLHIHQAPAGSNGGVVLNLDADGVLADASLAEQRDAGFNTASFVSATRADEVIVGAGSDDTVFARGGDDILRGRGGDDSLRGGLGDDTVSGGAGDDLVVGGFGDDLLRGGAGADTVFGGFGDDRIVGGLDADVITTGRGEDSIVFRGNPFEGAAFDPADGVRTIVGGEDTITDFDFDRDQIVINVTGTPVSSTLTFDAVDATADGADIVDGANLIVLRNSDNDGDPETPFLAGTAATQIAGLVEGDGAGYFVYLNSDLGVNRLVYSTNLADATADLKIVARFTDSEGAVAIAALEDYTADDFSFTGTGGLAEAALGYGSDDWG